MAALLLCAEAFAATIITIEVEKGNAVAAAKINGVPVRLSIDSGGGVVVLKPGIIERVNATRSGATTESTDIYGRKTQQATLTLRTLELGGSSFSNVAAQAAGDYVSQAPGDGTIGREFLSQFVVAYDYVAREITLFTAKERSDADLSCHGTTIPTIAHPEAIVVTMARTDQRPMRMLWDTGATHSFVKKSFADEHRLPIEAGTPFYTSQRFLLGPKDFGPLQFVIIDAKAPAGVDGYVGHNFFADHIVCIDPFNRVVRIRKGLPEN